MFHRAARAARAGDSRRTTTAKSGPSSKPAPRSTYKLVERTPIPFRQILDNITAAARVRPLVIQSLFMRVARRAAAAGRAGSLLRSAERDHRRRRPAEAGADLHRRPPAGRELRRAADRRRGRRDRFARARAHRPACGGVLRNARLSRQASRCIRSHSGSGLPFVSGANGSTTRPSRKTLHIATPA